MKKLGKVLLIVILLSVLSTHFQLYDILLRAATTMTVQVSEYLPSPVVAVIVAVPAATAVMVVPFKVINSLPAVIAYCTVD